MAPDDIINPQSGRRLVDRESYLKLKYGLMPRNLYPQNDSRFAGWKNPKLDNGTQMYMQVFWRDDIWGRLFYVAWRMYLKKRLKDNIKDTNPYAFLSHWGGSKGEVLTMRAFRDSHNRAVKKIGLRVGKYEGTTPHAHRHAYGKALESMGLEDENIISRALHHKSPNSKQVYTQPTIKEITEKMDMASKRLDNQPNRFNENVALDNIVKECENRWQI